jgi:endonuclease/exonuclease/phosphatase family metal-dependent hydrolase
MRVVTQNILGRQAGWASRRSVLADGFRRLKPDVVLFQEAIRLDDYDQVADLLGDSFEVVHQSERDDDEAGQGISIASRWPIELVAEIDLHVGSRTADFPCGALVANVAWPSCPEPVLVVNHKPSWRTNLAYEREQQAVITARQVEEIVARTGQHVVLGGDFDAVPESSSLRFWRGEQSLSDVSVSYRDAWQRTDPGHTFAPSRCDLIDDSWQTYLDRRIDYLLVRCADGKGPTLSVTRCDRVFDEPVDGVWGSDHFGVMADLRLP